MRGANSGRDDRGPVATDALDYPKAARLEDVPASQRRPEEAAFAIRLSTRPTARWKEVGNTDIHRYRPLPTVEHAVCHCQRCGCWFVGLPAW